MSINLTQLKADGWMSVAEACEYFSISERTLRKWYAKGTVDRLPIAGGRVLYREITKEDHLTVEALPLEEVAFADNDSDEEGFLIKESKPLQSAAGTKQKYWYDKDRDLYVFFLKNKSEPFALHGDVVSAMLADYSAHAGKAATIEEMSRKHGLSRSTINEVIKALGKTHSSSPYPDEVLEKTDEKSLIEDFLRIKEEQVIQKAEKLEWNSIKRDAQKWRAFQRNTLDDVFEKIAGAGKSYTVPKLNFEFSDKKERQFAAVMTPTDFHYGKYGWADESGTDFTREIAEERLIKKTGEAIDLVTEFGVPEKFIVGAGSDWFHIDTWGATTTAGTPQDTDGNFSQIFIEGCDLAVKYIDLLRQIAPVDIVLMAGNHDRQNSLSVLNYLYAWYRDCPDVSVRRSPAPRQYVQYGQSLLGFTHGDKPKLKDLPALMSIEARQMWGDCENRMWFTGDKHHEMALDIGGVQIYQMPCLAGEDRWHVQSGYTMSRKALAAYLIDIDRGMFSSIYANVTHDEE